MDLINAVLSWPTHIHTLCILSNANKFVEMTANAYENTARNTVWCAVCDLARHIQYKGVSKHLILFGSDVDLFEGAPFPSD